MTAYEIRNNIRYNEEQADCCARQIRRLKEKIAALEHMRERVAGLEAAFDDSQSRRRKELAAVQNRRYCPKAVSNYYSDMQTLLSGVDFQAVCHGFGEAKMRFQKESDDIWNQIEELSVKLGNQREQIVYWKEQLRYIS